MAEEGESLDVGARLDRLEQAVSGLAAIVQDNWRMMCNSYPQLGPWAAEGRRLATERQYAAHHARQAALAAARAATTEDAAPIRVRAL
ncbi:MAG: hypothetical protein ACYCWW_10930 [Deltaproteobacteria bacterium]